MSVSGFNRNIDIKGKVDFTTELNQNKLNDNKYDLLSKLNGDNENWYKFAKLICKNEFMKRYLNEVSSGVCKACGIENNSRSVIFHLNFNHFCNYKGVIKQNHKVIPDCDLCYTFNRVSFNSCSSKLMFIHQKCFLTIMSNV
jgi:hypothetical protein